MGYCHPKHAADYKAFLAGKRYPEIKVEIRLADGTILRGPAKRAGRRKDSPIVLANPQK